MSTFEPAGLERDFDFWEFVSCSKCHLPYIPDSGGPPTTPFWITECGHVVCNGHLRSDHTCAKCGAKEVQVAAIQKELEPPMSTWFTSVPQSFDTLAFAARFQIETLASLVRHYKKKSVHQRSLIERMKPLVQENKDLRATLEGLQSDNHRLQTYMEASDVPNVNGKRPMLSHRENAGAHTNSSPRSAIAPVGPNRLTIPPNQQKRVFNGRQSLADDENQNEELERPGSRRFTERYAYSASPVREERAALPTNLAYVQTNAVRQAQNRRLMQPEPAHIPTMKVNSEASTHHKSPYQPHLVRRHNVATQDDITRMPPPALPRNPPQDTQHTQAIQRGGFGPPTTPRHRDASKHFTQLATDHASSSFLDSTMLNNASSSNFRSATPSLQTQRFMPSVPSTPSGRQFFAPPSSAATASASSSTIPGSSRGNRDSTFRLSSGAASSSGQRLPFRPGQGAF